MSKSLGNNALSCGKGCCSSKSLKNLEFGSVSQIDDTTIARIINQISSDVVSGGDTGTGIVQPPIDGIPDPLQVNNLTVFQLAQLNNALIGTQLDIGNGDLVFINNTISSNSSIIVNPAIDFQIDPNLVVNGSYTRLNTTETRITDKVPVFGFIDPTGILALDNSDRGFEFNYVTEDPNDGSFDFNRGFFGYDKERDRFVAWKRSTINSGISGTDQNYERLGADLNTFDLDVVFTTEIRNPDYLIGGSPSLNINMVASSGTLNFTSLDQDHDVDNINYDIGSNVQYNVSNEEVHTIGDAGLTKGRFVVELIDRPNCSKIELKDTGTPGLFLYHEDNVEILTCDGTSVITIDSANDIIMKSDSEINITAPNGVCVGDVLKVDKIEACTGTLIEFNDDVQFNAGANITVPIFENDVCIKEGFSLETNSIVESCQSAKNMEIKTTGGNRTLTISSDSNLILEARNSGNVNINASGNTINLNSNLTTVNKGIEFEGTGSNPGPVNKTIWVDNIDNKLKKGVSGTDRPFVQSLSNPSSTNQVAVYTSNNNFTIIDTPVTINSANGNIDTNGGNLLVDGNISVTGTSLFTGIVNATNVNNNICSNSLIIDGTCYPISASIAGGGLNDLGRVLFFQDSTNQINLSNDYTGSGTTQILNTSDGETLSWDTLASLEEITLQNAYDASVSNVDDPTIGLSFAGVNDTNEIIIEDAFVYGSADGGPVFQITDLGQSTNYFLVDKINTSDVQVQIGDSGGDVDAIIFGNTDMHGTLDLIDTFSASIIRMDPDAGIIGSNGLTDIIACFNGNVDISGLIDPIGIIFQDQLGAPAAPSLTNSMIWTKSQCLIFTDDGPIDYEVILNTKTQSMESKTITISTMDDGSSDTSANSLQFGAGNPGPGTVVPIDSTAPASDGQVLWFNSAGTDFDLSDGGTDTFVLTYDSGNAPKVFWKAPTTVTTVVPYSLLTYKAIAGAETLALVGGTPLTIAYFTWVEAEYGPSYTVVGPRLIVNVGTLGAGLTITVSDVGNANVEPFVAAAGINTFILTTTDPTILGVDGILEFQIEKTAAGVDPEINGMTLLFDV